MFLRKMFTLPCARRRAGADVGRAAGGGRRVKYLFTKLYEIYIRMSEIFRTYRHVAYKDV